ncbi:hypothetical protein [Bradyrhizobium sp. RT3a]|uniref:hypothetical protein n=1 Tax=Bradyrhizobium sp. RT3a TaxID=3156333 RepID=UPI003391765A
MRVDSISLKYGCFQNVLTSDGRLLSFVQRDPAGIAGVALPARPGNANGSQRDVVGNGNVLCRDRYMPAGQYSAGFKLAKRWENIVIAEPSKY